MAEIAIFSTSFDRPTIEPVIREIEESGYNTWLYCSDRVARQQDQLSFSVGKDSEFSLSYMGISHIMSDIKSAWFRHPYLFNLDLDDRTKQMSLENEMDALQESIWQLIPGEAWMNHPLQMAKIQKKIAQLCLAKELGFEIPKTVVSNDWAEIDRFLDNDIVLKMSKGLIYVNNKSRVLYTTKLTKANRAELKDNSPFPGIYQDYVSKKR